MGSFQNIKVARTAICNLILGKNEDSHHITVFYFKLCLSLGSPPSKVYGNMRTIAARTSERF